MNRILAIALIGVASLAAQDRFARTRPNGAGVDVSKVQTLQDTVTAIHLAYAAQYPSIEIAGQTVKIAPVWYLLNNDFEIRAGDTVSVDVARSTNPSDSYLYALRITNPATNAHIELRDAAGVPLWSGRGSGSQPKPPRRRIDASSIVAVSGQIDAVVYGVGIRMPTIVIRTTDGAIAATLGPERVLLEADVELKAGQSITAKLAKCDLRDGYIVLELTLADGTTVVLREADGTPLWP